MDSSSSRINEGEMIELREENESLKEMVAGLKEELSSFDYVSPFFFWICFQFSFMLLLIIMVGIL